MYLTNALDLLNSHVSPIEKLSVNSVVSSPSVRSFCLQNSTFDPIEFRVAVKWWLGLDTSQGDDISRHNASIEVEAGAVLFPDHSQSRPADILVQHWNHGRPIALDISVVSPLNPSTLAEAGAMVGAVLEATESRKHQANYEKCLALGWVSTPLAVDSYGAWGREASNFLAQVIARLTIHNSLPKSQPSFELFSNLSICLITANARAILRRVKN
eukprot:Em0009g907a